MVEPPASVLPMAPSSSPSAYTGNSMCSSSMVSSSSSSSSSSSLPIPIASSSSTISIQDDTNNGYSFWSSSSSSSSFWFSILIFTGTVLLTSLTTYIIKVEQEKQESSDASESGGGGGDGKEISSSSSSTSNRINYRTTTTTMAKTTTNLSKRSVLALRQKYFSKSVSVSYLNSGGLMILRGKGSKLFDEHSTEYLDTRNNVCHVGHCHPKVVDSVSCQLSQLNTNTRYLHPNAVLLAERIVKLMPYQGSKLEVVFFVNSGSEANDLALRLARAHTKSNNTIVVEGGYHGHTFEVLKVSPYKFSKGTEFPLHYHQLRQHDNNDHTKLSPSSISRPPSSRNPDTGSFPTPSHNIYQVPVPDMYRGWHRHHYRRHHHGRNSVKTNEKGDYDSDEGCFSTTEREKLGERYAQYVVDACDYYRTQHNENVGAFIIEGGMSVGGVILPPRSYFELAMKAVRQAGGVWIADEVQTGFGRLGPGSSFWAFSHQHHHHDKEDRSGSDDSMPVTEVLPDIVTLGKPMGNGMAIGAVVTTREIADSFEALGIEYFNTFGGNPVACAASLAMLDILEDENLPQHAFEVGVYLRRQFEELNCRWIGDIRGSGLFMGIELIRPDSTSGNDYDKVPEPATVETSFICTILKDKYHILTSIDGLYDNVLVIKPPLVFSYQDVELFVKSFQMTIDELERLDEDDLKCLGKTPT